MKATVFFLLTLAATNVFALNGRDADTQATLRTQQLLAEQERKECAKFDPRYCQNLQAMRNADIHAVKLTKELITAQADLKDLQAEKDGICYDQYHSNNARDAEVTFDLIRICKQSVSYVEKNKQADQDIAEQKQAIAATKQALARNAQAREQYKSTAAYFYALRAPKNAK